MDVLTKAQFLHDGIQNVLRNKNMLRGKQRDAFCAMANMSIEQIAHSYFKLPTGFGKTVMFSLLASEYINQIRAKRANLDKNKVIILVPRLSLIEQTKDKLKAFANIDKVSVFTGKNKRTDREIIISTYQSMEKLFHRMDTKNIGLIIADEAHHAIGDKRISVLNRVSNNAPIIGFTATPVYSEKHAVSDLLGAEIYSMSIGEAVNSEMLCPVKNILYRTSMIFDPTPFGFVQGSGDFNWKKIIDEGTQFDIMVREIAQIYANAGCDGTPFRDMKTMINCPNIDIAIAQARAINMEMGRDVAIAMHSRQRNFAKLMQDFRNNKFNVVCQVNTLTEGFDDESVTLCINYPSASPVRIEQASGRVLRTNQQNPNKIAYVLDTIFRGGNQEAIENTIISAKEYGQVLFRDVAGGAVLIPERFQREIHQCGETIYRDDVNFDFDIITDNTTLMSLERQYNDWVASGNKSWLTPTMLIKYCNLKASETIEKRLIAMRNDERMVGRIQYMRLKNGRVATCLRGDPESINLFNQILNEKWLSPSQLEQYCHLQMPSIEKRLYAMQKDPKMQNYIAIRQLIGSRPAPFLRDTPDAIKLFQQIVNEKWLSASVLVKYCKLNNVITIERRLREMRNDPRMQGRIKDVELQDRRTQNKRQAPCLHGDSESIELFKQILEEQKWLTPSLLVKRCPISTPTIAEKRLCEAKKDPRMQGYIEDQPIIGGRTAPCLLNDEKAIFLFNQIIKEKWLTPTQLSKRLHYHRKRIEAALNEMRKDPRMKGLIKDMPLQNTRQAPCLRDSQEAINLFLTIFKEQTLAAIKHGTVIVAVATLTIRHPKIRYMEYNK